MTKAIEVALAAWREAERNLTNAANGDRDALQAEVDRTRGVFQRLSAARMEERIDALHEAEKRRHAATPSTPDFHAAAKEEMEIAADIWDTARSSDEDSPQTGND